MSNNDSTSNPMPDYKALGTGGHEHCWHVATSGFYCCVCGINMSMFTEVTP